MTTAEIAYKPTVSVWTVYLARCEDCGFELTRNDIPAAKAEAEKHRQWHQKTIETLENELRCGYCEQDAGPELKEGRPGGLPHLVCRHCGSDW